MPKREPAKVLIANQARYIRNLIARCEEVVRERDALRVGAIALQDAATKADVLVADIDRAHTRLQGWQDCARELLELERTHIRIDRVKDAPF